MKITHLLFDCDNTLVLSEELAFEGCADLLNEICQLKGVKLEFTGRTLIKEFVGQNFRGMMTSLQSRFGFDLTPEELNSYVTREEEVVINKIKDGLGPCPNVDPVLERLASEGKYELAVVSSSALRRVKASLDKVGQSKFFGDRVFSAATSLDPPTSKPDPAIYLHAAAKLNANPSECVAIEDSKSGTLSAARAGMSVIGYLGPYEGKHRDEMEQTLRDAGAVVTMDDWSDFDKCLKTIESSELRN